MCLAFYLATDIEVPLLEWHKECPAFFVAPVGKDAKAMHKHFQGLSVRYVGSHEGCGCGFSRDGRDTEELSYVNDSRERLIALIDHLLCNKHPVRMFICWEGEQAHEPLETMQLSLAAFSQYECDMDTRVLLEITK